ncbi:surfactin synthase subunit 3-like [Dysidea avara]|uniref:surfactin synthase subunit 3-like n=1 Tax=Dysidea avara TaxID=196820 RepID=UPI00332FCDA4
MPVPTGMCSTYIGGVGVRGYRNVESLSGNKAFIATPTYIKDIFPDEGKLYNTGDMVRVLPDPLKDDTLVLHFIGRLDRQVKVGGVRLDLTEIEHAILKHPAVQNASVVVNKERADTKHLAAYIVLNKDLKMSEFQTHIKQILPAYMTPTSIFAIDSIPLNNNGKVHQAQLQAIKTSSGFHLVQSTSSRKPQSEREKVIASIWASELGILEDDIIMQFDFFKNGGHSLVAQRMI